MRFSPLLSGILILTIWSLIYVIGLVPSNLLPSPYQVLVAMKRMYLSGELTTDLLASAQRWWMGYLAGSCLGVCVGLLIAGVRSLRALFEPAFFFFSSIPNVVLIPIFIIWLGIGDLQKYAFVAWGTFFPVWLSVLDGFRRIPREHFLLAESLELKGLRYHLKFLLPSLVPSIFLGMQVSVATATFALAAAEMSGADSGVVFRIFQSHEMFQTEKMYGGVVLISVFSVTLSLSFQKLRLTIFPWMRSSQGELENGR